MEHWLAVGRDIWIAAKWVVPPILFSALPGAMNEPVPGPFLALLIVAYFSYAAAILGWWA